MRSVLTLDEKRSWQSGQEKEGEEEEEEENLLFALPVAMMDATGEALPPDEVAAVEVAAAEVLAGAAPECCVRMCDRIRISLSAE